MPARAAGSISGPRPAGGDEREARDLARADIGQGQGAAQGMAEEVVAAFGQADRPALAGLKVVLDEAVEQEPAGLGGGGIGVAIGLAGVFLVEHAELQHPVVQVLFGRLPGLQVEAPAMELG